MKDDFPAIISSEILNIKESTLDKLFGIVCDNVDLFFK